MRCLIAPAMASAVCAHDALAQERAATSARRSTWAVLQLD